MKSRKMAIVAHAHRLKLVEPGLDRVNGDIRDGTAKVELVDHTIALTIPDGLMGVPYYDAYLSDGSNIVDLLRKEGL